MEHPPPGGRAKKKTPPISAAKCDYVSRMKSISRRSFLTQGSAAAVFHRAATAAVRPNILWVSCEDAGTHIGCYGDRHAITPNIDRLAAQGVRFTRAYTVAGVCAR